MRLAYFSPFSPQKSGIADYSEELLPHLADAGAEIDLFVEGFEPSNEDIRARFRRFDYVRDPSALRRLSEYDAVVYHVGNDHRYHAGVYDAARAHPGVVVFHDFALQNFFLGLARERGDAQVYLDELEAYVDAQSLDEAAQSLARGTDPPQAAAPLAFPLNGRLARGAEAIIVHSEWSRARFAEIAPATPVARVNHHITARAAALASDALDPNAASSRPAHDSSQARGEEFEKFHEARATSSSPVRISSFGLITADKGIERALRALAALKRDGHDFRYTLVGAPNNFFDVRALIRLHDLDDRAEITGHVSLQEFERRMSETDIAINLRERTVGETSGSLCRLMAAGVCTIVSNVGWFSELPADAVVKVDADDYADPLLDAYLSRLVGDARLRARVGANARRHVLAEHRIEQSAADYLSFIREVVAARTRRQFVGDIASQISLLGADAVEDESLLRSVATEVSALAPAHVFAAVADSSSPRRAAAEASHTHPNGDGQDADAHEDIAVETLPAEVLTGETTGAARSVQQSPSARASSASATSLSALPSSDAPPPVSSSPVSSPSTASPSASSSSSAAAPSPSSSPSSADGRLRGEEGVDYKRAAIEYPRKLDAERHHYLYTKPFYNLVNKPPKHSGLGLDAETQRHFTDFANLAAALALPPGSKILDVGCGSGWLSEYFARLGYDVTGIDISPDLIEMSRERLARVPYHVDHETPLRSRFLAHDAESAPLDEQFDAVICYDSLHHFVDERAVMHNLSSMLRLGGLLFVLEGDKPPVGSETEAELVGVMREFETLESPFDPAYLRALLDEHGLKVVGDFVNVSGLFEREVLEGAGTLLPVTPEQVNYLLCKKVTDAGTPASSVPDSKRPGLLRAQITATGETEWSGISVAAGAWLHANVEVENTGDTLWLSGREARPGVVMPGVKLLDADGRTLRETHGEPPLPCAVAPGERVSLDIEIEAPREPGTYRIKIDLVAQHVSWFEAHGSAPLVLEFEVP